MALASTLLMVRPFAFGVNEETVSSNFFLQQDVSKNNSKIENDALVEFDRMVEILRKHEIDLIIIEDTPEPEKPTAVFPVDWICTTPENVVMVFPMLAPNRRTEKRDDIIKKLSENFLIADVQDWTEFEVEGKFLEGTGSMVIDHDNKVIYACYSPRTDTSVLEKFANANNFRAFVFFATDLEERAVYHTNLVMSLCEDFAVLCLEAIDEEWERIAIRQLLDSSGHEIIRITKEQMHAFAGNILQVKNKKGKKFLVMSETAYDSLTNEQKEEFLARSEILTIPVAVIERTGGSSVQSMMAEIFLKRK